VLNLKVWVSFCLEVIWRSCLDVTFRWVTLIVLLLISVAAQLKQLTAPLSVWRIAGVLVKASAVFLGGCALFLARVRRLSFFVPITPALAVKGSL
jgi:hypothetical protein